MRQILKNYYFNIFLRPDLVDWRNIKSKHVRERLESAFYIAEREYGVTRLLDPEGMLCNITTTFFRNLLPNLML